MNEAIKAILDNFGNVGALLVAGGLIIFLLNKMRNGSKIDNVTGGLYEQLNAQLTILREEVKECRAEMAKVYEERNELKEQLVIVQARVDHLESCEKSVDVLKAKLDEKDSIIMERDLEIKRLMHELLQLKDRLHHLELRLSQDEMKFCQDCSRK